MALHLLKDTHDFFSFPTPLDAVFVHKSLTRSGNLFNGNDLFPRITFPLDEFLCYAGSHLWFMYPVAGLRRWMGISSSGETIFEEKNVDKRVGEFLTEIKSNITELGGGAYALHV